MSTLSCLVDALDGHAMQLASSALFDWVVIVQR